MSNETKIGLMATVVIAVFIWGYKFIQGKNMFSSNNTYYVEYNDVAELQPSAPVFKSGLQVGTVTDIGFKSDDMEKVIVTIDVDGGLQIPKTATADLVYQGIMGGRAIYLNFKKPCEGANCVQDGDFIKAKGKGFLGSLVDPNEIPEYLDKLSAGAKDLVSGLNEAMSDPEAANTPLVKILNNLAKTLSNLTTSTEELNKLMAGSAGPLKGTLKNLEELTGNLKNNNDKITTVLDNTAAFTSQLREANLGATIEKTTGTMESAKATLDNLKVTLEKANGAFDGISKILDDVQQGKGSLGKLAKDEALYEKLNTAAKEVELLLQDVRLHPKRYTRILSKKETAYEYPEKDPAKSN